MSIEKSQMQVPHQRDQTASTWVITYKNCIPGTLYKCTFILSNWKICTSNCYCLYNLEEGLCQSYQSRESLELFKSHLLTKHCHGHFISSHRNLPAFFQEEIFELIEKSMYITGSWETLPGKWDGSVKLYTSGRVSSCPLSSVALQDVRRPRLGPNVRHLQVDKLVHGTDHNNLPKRLRSSNWLIYEVPKAKINGQLTWFHPTLYMSLNLFGFPKPLIVDIIIDIKQLPNVLVY